MITSNKNNRGNGKRIRTGTAYEGGVYGQPVESLGRKKPIISRVQPITEVDHREGVHELTPEEQAREEVIEDIRKMFVDRCGGLSGVQMKLLASDSDALLAAAAKHETVVITEDTLAVFGALVSAVRNRTSPGDGSLPPFVLAGDNQPAE